MSEPLALGPCSASAAVAWQCPECSTIYYGDDARARTSASRCCNATCPREIDGAPCGKAVRKSYTYCDDCTSIRQAEHRREADARAYLVAEKVSAEDYDGPAIYFDGGPSGSSMKGDGYYRDVHELIDLCRGMDVPIPAYVWACDTNHPHTAADDLVYSALEEAYDDATDDVPRSEIRRLQELLNEWWEEQGMTWYSESRTRAVFIPLHMRDPEADAGFEPVFSDPDL